MLLGDVLCSLNELCENLSILSSVKERNVNSEALRLYLQFVVVVVVVCLFSEHIQNHEPTAKVTSEQKCVCGD